ncbi:PREDICTED: alpha-sarcoglycan-like [Cyprinodon variegatus]|uniref:alpha-sarcoglycan-like n=1 Tax=Cyprinodon variegatus TaxID=28743 RepID=UPI000742A935|nr:PREDICTED: alpha-sarcoglycan-like [Cyprinodon variegatus]
MAELRSWCFILAVFAASLYGISAEIKFTTPVGRLFTYEVMREKFQNDFETSSKLYTGVLHDDPMVFKCKKQGFPDLPEWLRFIQRHPFDNGFLYGTPMSPGKYFIEIYAINKISYDAARELLVIKVIPEKLLPYQAEFFIQLREVEKVLPSSVQIEIKQDLQKLWNNEALEMINISNALDRGGRVPLPLAGHYEGVYVKVGSKKYFSKCLQRVMSPEYQRECATEAKVKIPGECTFCKIPSNCITWCKTELVRRPASQRFHHHAYPHSLSYFAMKSNVPHHESPTAMFCCGGALIRDVYSHSFSSIHIQLYHHQTIHGNTEELRSMASQRGVPAPLSTLPMFNSRTGERASPLQSDSIPLIMAQQEPYSDTLPRK